MSEQALQLSDEKSHAHKYSQQFSQNSPAKESQSIHFQNSSVTPNMQVMDSSIENRNQFIKVNEKMVLDDSQDILIDNGNSFQLNSTH